MIERCGRTTMPSITKFLRVRIGDVGATTFRAQRILRGTVVTDTDAASDSDPLVPIAYVVKLTGMSRSTIIRLARNRINGFPPLHELDGTGHKKMLRFNKREIDAWWARQNKPKG